LSGITHQNGEFTRLSIRIADDSCNPQHSIGFRIFIDGNQRNLPIVIDLGEISKFGFEKYG
jgi:hypothetical protein